MAITDWPADERPREKLIAQGAQSLSDAELLAIFLRVGVVGKSAVDVARDLLTQFGSLTALVAAPVDEFCAVHGMGEAKYAQLQATVELARRALGETLAQTAVLDKPKVLHDYLRLQLGRLPHECFYLVLLDTEYKLLRGIEVFRGTLNAAAVFPRELVKLALAHNAFAAVIAHNHPHGGAEPSVADVAVTQKIKAAFDTVDVRLLDHVIIAQSETVSFAARGMI